MLERYNCPVPFHEVRTRFLGNIATPSLDASPIKTVESLWGGKLPEVETIDDLNELVGALTMGLWNRLSRHQDRTLPFRLTAVPTKPTREGLAALALIRTQELDGFVDGLFGLEETVHLPERAHHGLDALGEMRALFAAVLDLAGDQSVSESTGDLRSTLRHMQEMRKTSEREMHAVMMSNNRARRELIASLPATKPTLH